MVMAVHKEHSVHSWAGGDSPGDEGFAGGGEVVNGHVQVHLGEMAVVDPALDTAGGNQVLAGGVGPQGATPSAHPRLALRWRHRADRLACTHRELHHLGGRIRWP